MKSKEATASKGGNLVHRSHDFGIEGGGEHPNVRKGECDRTRRTEVCHAEEQLLEESMRAERREIREEDTTRKR